MSDDSDIFDFNSGDEKEAKGNEAKASLTSTPINKSILKNNPTTISFSRKSALANLVRNKTDEKAKEDGIGSRPADRSRRNPKKTMPAKATTRKEKADDPFEILSLSTSQE